MTSKLYFSFHTNITNVSVSNFLLQLLCKSRVENKQFVHNSFHVYFWLWHNSFLSSLGVEVLKLISLTEWWPKLALHCLIIMCMAPQILLLNSIGSTTNKSLDLFAETHGWTQEKSIVREYTSLVHKDWDANTGGCIF